MHDLLESTRPQQPQKNHQPRQHKTNQALAEHAQGASHKAPAGQDRIGSVMAQKSQPETPDGHADPGGDQHVVIDVLTANQKSQAGAQHDGGTAGHGLAGDSPRAQVQGDQHQGRMQRRHQPQRPGVAAEDSQRHRLQPVQQRRLVKKRDAVRAGRQPVATLKHPATDFAVTTFIGNRERPQGRQHQQDDTQACHDPPGIFPLAQGGG